VKPATEKTAANRPRGQEAYTRLRVDFWNAAAGFKGRFGGIRHAYHRRLAEVYSFLVPPGMRVLELGCASGDLLAALRPAHGVGVDFSPAMLAEAREKYPNLDFIQADVHDLDLDETFDYIICADLVNDLWDVLRVFETIARHSHPGTRVILNTYSRLWEAPRAIAERMGIAPRLPVQNWLTIEDLDNLLTLADFESIRSWREILCPARIPALASFANRYLVKLWPFRSFALTNFAIARPSPQRRGGPEPTVTVVVAARNEEGNIPAIFERIPEIGGGTELLFVEGNSTDDTYGAIEREISRHPSIRASLMKQPGRGKGDAVRTGFEHASGDVLMILDADLTVPPEDLPRFYEAWRSGRAEFVNGVRLVYPMEDRAMRFFNFLGNKFFSVAFSWLLSQTIKDTLCGTKVLSKRDYEVIAANRAYFGDFDPFGDFDLIFGAARFNMKIVDLPVRYRERTWGETNIRRWSHGWLLLRMMVTAMRRIKFV